MNPPGFISTSRINLYENPTNWIHAAPDISIEGDGRIDQSRFTYHIERILDERLVYVIRDVYGVSRAGYCYITDLHYSTLNDTVNLIARIDGRFFQVVR